MFFDARTAKLLRPGEHLVVGGCPGLRLEVSVTRKTWTYRYKLDGRMKQLALGQWPAMPVAAAVAAWQALRDKRAEGIAPQRKVATVGPYRVRALVDHYISGHLLDARAPAGALAAQRALLRLLDESPAFADQPASSVSRSVAFELLEARKATPTATAKLRSLLGAAWDYALDAGRLDGDTPNWWRLVLRGRLKSKGKIIGGAHVGQQRRVLQAGEIAGLLAWLPNMHALGRDTTLLYLWTCARGAEILAMRPEHVSREPDGWWWTVPKAQTKNARFAAGVDLRVPLCGQALAVVRRRLTGVGASGWLFEDARGEQYTQQDYSTYIYSMQPHSVKVQRRQGAGLVLPVTGWTPHNLRRTGRTLLSSLGCRDEVAEAILGHLPPPMVGTYNSHSYDAEKREWLGRLAGWLEALPLKSPSDPMG